MLKFIKCSNLCLSICLSESFASPLRFLCVLPNCIPLYLLLPCCLILVFSSVSFCVSWCLTADCSVSCLSQQHCVLCLIAYASYVISSSLKSHKSFGRRFLVPVLGSASHR